MLIECKQPKYSIIIVFHSEPKAMVYGYLRHWIGEYREC